jgi:OOP family OmpA-OmpF porin
MNKLAKIILAASAVVAMSAQAQTDIKASTPNSAYAQAANGTIVRSGTGLCWRTGYWTPADAVPGCDGALVAALLPQNQLLAQQLQYLHQKKSRLQPMHSLTLTKQS